MRKFLVLFFIVFQILNTFSQEVNTDSLQVIDYSRTREYVIAEIKVTGVKYLNPTHLVSISGLHRGQEITIPGSDISNAIKNYWRHGLFADVKIIITKIEGTNVYLEIQLVEQPRMSDLIISGIKKAEQDDIKEKIELKKGTQITDNIINNTVTIIKRHYIEKGFFNIDLNIRQKADTAGQNRVVLYIDIDKNERVKIEEIIFEDNEVFTDKKLRHNLKKTKQRDLNIFKGSKYIEADYKEDKIKLIDFYNKNGYRDAKIVKEELYPINEERVGLKLTMYEGNQYYIRNIRWVGNTKYPSEYLTRVLGIKEKQIYDKQHLEDRLNMDEDAISTLYMDNGYLFFSVTPVEMKVEEDSVDLELRIYEGNPATISQIIINGNTKTNEHVVRRELYTRPGELFSKSDLMRSYREIANLGHFNPENIGVDPLPNQADGTVDIKYTLEERANDQLELSGGWGGGYGFVGSVGVKFTNLAVGKILDKSAWRPVPTGDGQTFSIRAQSNIRYQGFNMSFLEPWFGGKKPNSLSISTNYTIIRYLTSSGLKYTTKGTFQTLGGAVGFGKRLKWPDDYFSIYSELGYNQYKLNDYPGYPLNSGSYNLVTFKNVLSRSSQDQMIYPRKGSALSLTVTVTPPFSLINGKDYSKLEYTEKFKNIEFHKWVFKSAWYTQIAGDLVLALKSEFGALGFYNENIGYPVFEKFDMGGSGLSGYTMMGTDVIPLRGYQDGALTPKKTYITEDNYTSTYDNGNVYTRFYSELRYPISLNPSATLYGLVFLEGGNVWDEWDKFNPYAIKRSAGVGIRAFLPMFGLLGFDWGYGFDYLDDGSGKKGEFHFIIGQQL
ncbi:MAG: outer membrane protein assembly factor BamA [Bacteroidales bacterium]|nr:outer membrane protein assembly factor BamA [Bacteroidales bacterium]MBN2819403.1 outer membrane protein assembly factor BamA [Bacteroidales bacterium]